MLELSQEEAEAVLSRLGAALNGTLAADIYLALLRAVESQA